MLPQSEWTEGRRGVEEEEENLFIFNDTIEGPGRAHMCLYPDIVKHRSQRLAFRV